MNKQEKEVLDGVVTKLNAANTFEDFEFVTGNLLRNISSELPEGNIKEFFQKVEKHVPIFLSGVTESEKTNVKVDLTTETEVTIEKLKKALKILKKTRANLEQGSFPKGIPQKIIETYKYFFDMGIFFIDKAIQNYKQANHSE